MVTEYKVVKPFGVAKKNDTFFYGELEEAYYMNEEVSTEHGSYSYRNMMVTPEIMQKHIDAKLVKPAEDAKEIVEKKKVEATKPAANYEQLYADACKTILALRTKNAKIVDKLTSLYDAYQDDVREANMLYRFGMIPNFTRVERVTVLANLKRLIEEVVNDIEK